MVQDTSPSQELYLSSDVNLPCGGWGIAESSANLSTESGQSVSYDKLRERTVLWAVSIPGEASWCAEYLDGPEITGLNPGMRRSHCPIVLCFLFSRRDEIAMSCVPCV